MTESRNQLKKMLTDPEIPEDIREFVRIFMELTDKRDKEGWNRGEREEVRHYLKDLIDMIEQ